MAASACLQAPSHMYTARKAPRMIRGHIGHWGTCAHAPSPQTSNWKPSARISWIAVATTSNPRRDRTLAAPRRTNTFLADHSLVASTSVAGTLGNVLLRTAHRVSGSPAPSSTEIGDDGANKSSPTTAVGSDCAEWGAQPPQEEEGWAGGGDWGGARADLARWITLIP
eukprot:9470943-Pyramimonas_sp.AAC.2